MQKFFCNHQPIAPSYTPCQRTLLALDRAISFGSFRLGIEVVSSSCRSDLNVMLDKRRAGRLKRGQGNK